MACDGAAHWLTGSLAHCQRTVSVVGESGGIDGKRGFGVALGIGCQGLVSLAAGLSKRARKSASEYGRAISETEC